MPFYFIAMFFLLLANFGCNKDTTITKTGSLTKTDASKTRNGFQIYVISSTDFKTSTYDYDSTWQNFLKNCPLPDTKITDEDFEWYDWDKQQIHLSEKGKERFLKCLPEEKNLALDPRFIVMLNGKRLYAGRVILRYTQMGIQYPILSYDENGGNWKESFEKHPLLWLTPYLIKPKNEENPETGTVKNPEIHDYFKEKGKLK